MSEPPPLPSPQPLKIEFELTIEDLREALAPRPVVKAGALLSGPASVTGAQVLRGIMGWILFVGVAVAMFVLLNDPSGRSGRRSGSEFDVDIGLAFIPSLTGALCVGVLLATIAASTLMSTRRRLQPPQDRNRAARIIAVGFALTIFLLLVGTFVSVYWRQDRTWRLNRWHVALLNAVPWIVVIIFVIALVSVLRRRGTRILFESNPTFRRKHTLRMDAEGIFGDDGVSANLYRWPCFRSAWETQRLLVLDDEGNRRHMIPKRAMPDPAQLDQARALIGTYVADTQFLVTVGGFPVTPIPVIPISAPGETPGDSAA